jgi:hypothetical protein
MVAELGERMIDEYTITTRLPKSIHVATWFYYNEQMKTKTVPMPRASPASLQAGNDGSAGFFL